MIEDIAMILMVVAISLEFALWVWNKVDWKGGWIPCETEVPIKNGKYIVMIKDAIYPTTLTYSVGEWHDDDANYYNVIAWQPLPEPYKEK